ncbi:hypothetical protein BASA81_007361 [Batrachochytrium salamandrivorans]|nr:hypothetical protein BASA81_007361 [Batrachochytrium salamandrivorans]
MDRKQQGLLVLAVASVAAAVGVLAVLYRQQNKPVSPSISSPSASTPPPPPSSTSTSGRPSAFLLRSQSFDFHCEIPSIRNAMFCKIARDYCPELFDGQTDAQISIDQIRGGITNLLWKLSNDRGRSILVRAYGENTEVLIDRELECSILQELSDLHFAPKLYGLFANGRVEEFLDDAKPFEPSYQMGERSPVDFPVLIAKELHKMHSITQIKSIPVSQTSTPQLWPLLKKFHALVAQVDLPRVELLELDQFAKELEWLQTVLPSPKSKFLDISNQAKQIAFRNVFAHNDLLGGNVLYLAKENRVQFIDFEYGAFNYAAFDVANHFCEYAGFDFDLKRWYPGFEAQQVFWRAYVGEEADVSDEVIAELVHWTNKFALAANALWFLWAVYQAKHSKIHNVDFFAFAQRRRQGYFDQKHEFFGHN